VSAREGDHPKRKIPFPYGWLVRYGLLMGEKGEIGCVGFVLCGIKICCFLLVKLRGDPLPTLLSKIQGGLPTLSTIE
jgi:hypothetical protein